MTPKILFLDIETIPAVCLVWDIYKPHISVDQIVTPTSVLCFSAKWLNEKQVQFIKAQKQGGSEFERMIRRAHELLSEADAVCHYNGTTFDVPRLNAEFIKLGLKPPPPVPQIDLKKVVNAKFGFLSSKLAFVGPYLKIGEKVKNDGWPLWIGCMDGDKESWKKMQQYNIQDVLLLEKLYHKILPWIDNHPNMNLYKGATKPLCPNCGSDQLRSNGLRRATTYIYRRLRCDDCGKWSRERKALKGSAQVRD